MASVEVGKNMGSQVFIFILIYIDSLGISATDCSSFHATRNELTNPEFISLLIWVSDVILSSFRVAQNDEKSIVEGPKIDIVLLDQLTIHSSSYSEVLTKVIYIYKMIQDIDNNTLSNNSLNKSVHCLNMSKRLVVSSESTLTRPEIS